MSDDRNEALRQIRELVESHGLTLAEIEAALTADRSVEPKASQRSRVLVRVLSYIGGTFVFAGIAAFIGMHWEDFNSAARVVVSLGSGLAVFALAVIAMRDERFHVAATPLSITAAALIPTGLMVAFNEYGSGGDWQTASMITSATVSAQFALTWHRFRRTVLEFFAILFGTAFWSIALDKLGLDRELIALTIGAMLILLAIPIHRSADAAISPPLFLFGSWGFLLGLFELVEGSLLEIVFLAVACGFVYLGVQVRSRALNFTSTVAILAYTGYFTGKHFANSIGWPLALIAFGLLMIGISALALRIDRKYLRAN